MTVLFADLSGFTAVAERMDPEAVKSLIDRALRRLGAEVERFGGTVDKYIGDNVMALFGAPVAHEDDAERALRAALAMQDAMEEINEALTQDTRFALRVGVNTGEVLAGAIGDSYTVTGDTVNVASRLQSAARPGTVTVGERTERATRGAVGYRRLEPLSLKGKANPVPAWEAVELVAENATSRPDLAALPFVGRDRDLRALQEAYERVVRDGRAHMVTLVGEAGVGKSRLLREFGRHLHITGSPPALRTGRCLPYGSGIVYWALGEVIREEAGIVDLHTSGEAWSELCSYVRAVLPGEAEPSEPQAALIGRSLGLYVPEGLEPPESNDPERMREVFFSALRSVVEGSAQRKPLVLAFEDIHWADDGMLDVIEHLARSVRGPLLVVCLARDELLDRRPGWGGGRRAATQIFLEPLGPETSQDLVSCLLGKEGTPPELAARVAERSGGNPLFAEEIVRRLQEEGAGWVGDLPDTIQGLLAARLDALEPFERRLIQQAAVAGRTFWEGALAPVAEEEGKPLGPALVALQEKDLLAPEAESRLAGERELAFKHVLIRDVAYGMLPKAVRSRKHFQLGRFIEHRAGDRTDEVVALLAEHYGQAATLGGETGADPDELIAITSRALRFLEEAGDSAARLYANREALTHYGKALDLVDDSVAIARIGEKQGDVALRLGRVDTAIEVWGECLEHHRGEEHLERVADLHRKLGAALAVKGEREAAIENYQRGISLLKNGPPRLELVRLYEEAAWLYLQTGDNMLAIYAAEKALRLAERLGETSAASRAHGIFGRVFGRIGETEKARVNLERSVELARGADPGESILALLALGRHLELSEADTKAAASAYDEGLRLAEQVGDLPSQVELHAAVAQLAADRADWEQVLRSTDASAELAEREGLGSMLGVPSALRGLLQWRDGRLEEAERSFREAQALADQVGWSELSFQALYGLALVLRDRDAHLDAVTALEHALDVCERAGLAAQSVQAKASRAVVLALAGREEQAREGAVEAHGLAELLQCPIGQAACLEACGATALDPGEGAVTLAEARAAWTGLGRPLEAARCVSLAAWRLRAHDPERALELSDAGASEFDRLGVRHLAARARAAVLDN